MTDDNERVCDHRAVGHLWGQDRLSALLGSRARRAALKRSAGACPPHGALQAMGTLRVFAAAGACPPPWSVAGIVCTREENP